MIGSTWFTALLVFVAAVFGTLSLALLAEAVGSWLRRRQAGKRLQELIEEGKDSEASDRARNLLRTTPRKPAKDGGGIDLREALPGREKVRELLQQARLEWSPETFFLITLGLALGAGAMIRTVSGSLALATLAAGLVSAAPYLYARRRRTRRFREFEEQFPEAIDLLTRAIRAGHPLVSGMRMVADEGPPEVAAEFRQSAEEQRFGLPFEDALLGMVDRTDLMDVRIFAIAVLIQREVGGNLAEILDNLAQTIRGRFYIRRQLRVYTAQGKLSGYALGAMPFAVGGIIGVLQPEYIGVLFTTLLGWFLVGTAVVMQIVGALWIRKIINIDI